MFNHRVGKMPNIFPDAEAENRVIWVTGTGASLDFTCFMSDILPDLQGGPAKIQCFPLYLYEEVSSARQRQDDLFNMPSNDNGGRKRREAISDEGGLSYFHTSYPGEEISKQSVFLLCLWSVAFCGLSGRIC